MNQYILIGLGLCAVLIAGCGASDNIGGNPPAIPTAVPPTGQTVVPTVVPPTAVPDSPTTTPAAQQPANPSASPFPTSGAPETQPELPLATVPAAPGDDSQPGIGDQGSVMANMAREQLATTLGVSVETIQVSSVEAVEWPDSSLGCAEPGQMALQVITPGYRIRLSHNGQEYVYHTDSDRVVVPCNAGR